MPVMLLLLLLLLLLVVVPIDGASVRTLRCSLIMSKTTSANLLNGGKLGPHVEYLCCISTVPPDVMHILQYRYRYCMVIQKC